MKFAESADLAHLNSLLTNVNTPDALINARLEAYHCKPLGKEKQMFQAMDDQMVNQLSKSPGSLPASDIGEMTDSQTRKAFFVLIATLNTAFTDYDFSQVGVDQFRRETDLVKVRGAIDGRLVKMFEDSLQYSSYSASPSLYAFGTSTNMCETVWNALQTEIQYTECDIFTYVQDQPECDPFTEEGVLWSFNYFFYNRKLRKVLFFYCRALHHMIDPSPAPSDDEMDMMFGAPETDRAEIFVADDDDDDMRDHDMHGLD